MIAIIAFFGCTHRVSTDISTLQNQLSQKEQAVRSLEVATKDKDRTIKQLKGQLDKETKLSAEAEMRAKQSMQTSKASAPMVSPLLPPDAKAGECYARVFVPPVYRSVTEQRLKRGESERVETIPAKYEWVEEKVLVKGASERMEIIPAKYEWQEEQVLVKEASSRLEEIPAKYDWVEEEVLVRPAETVWKKGRGLVEKIDTTGEIMCLVEIPASYRTVKKKVMVNPPATRTIEIPAAYKTVKKEVMVNPPTTRTVEILAEFKTVKVKKMISPPKEQRITIPAEFQTITKTEQVSDGRMEWRRVLCETNMSPAVIARIQTALSKAGHDPGPIDGVIGLRTHAAIMAFQKEKGLASGALTYRTIESLGVKLGG